VKRETREKLLCSRKFVEWYPERKPQERKSSKFARGRSFSYTGQTYTNLAADEKHYTAAEIAKLWNVSVDLARNTFTGEPGVLKWQRPATKTKRAYSLLRVPESILVRVHRRLTERG
jgi:hypothetical protein